VDNPIELPQRLREALDPASAVKASSPLSPDKGKVGQADRDPWIYLAARFRSGQFACLKINPLVLHVGSLSRASSADLHQSMTGTESVKGDDFSTTSEVATCSSAQLHPPEQASDGDFFYMNIDQGLSFVPLDPSRSGPSDDHQTIYSQGLSSKCETECADGKPDQQGEEPVT